MTDYTVDEMMSSNTSDSFNTTTETTDSTDTETMTDSTDTETVTDSTDTETVSDSSTDVWISNVYKVKDGDKKRFEVILVKTVSGPKTVTVFYADAKKTERIDAPSATVGDTLPDGALVVGVSKGKEQRVYATVHLTVDDLADKFDGLVWAPRTKNRTSAGD